MVRVITPLMLQCGESDSVKDLLKSGAVHIKFLFSHKCLNKAGFLKLSTLRFQNTDIKFKTRKDKHVLGSLLTINSNSHRTDLR